jgi:hypothetical protein
VDGRLVVLDPDVARVFTTAKDVNAGLRALITTMPPTVAGGMNSWAHSGVRGNAICPRARAGLIADFP